MDQYETVWYSIPLENGEKVKIPTIRVNGERTLFYDGNPIETSIEIEPTEVHKIESQMTKEELYEKVEEVNERKDLNPVKYSQIIYDILKVAENPIVEKLFAASILKVPHIAVGSFLAYLSLHSSATISARLGS